MKRTFFFALIFLLAGLTVFFLFFETPGISPFCFERIVAIKSFLGMKNKVVQGKNGWLFFEPELTYVRDSIPPDNVRKIVGFDSTLRDNGMVLFVVPIPNKIDIYPEKFTSIPASRPVKPARLQLVRRLEKEGVTVIDLAPAFEKAKKSMLVFDPYQTHWTAAGIETAARVIARRIDSVLAERGTSGTTSYSVNDTVLKTCGDLLDRLFGARFSNWYPLPVHQVYGADGSLYTDDRKSEIMILGDSFVDHGRWFNAHLGAQIARFIRHPTRTYFSLLANTEGPAMYRLKPSHFPRKGIVIWAFSSRVLQYHMGSPWSN